MNVRRVFGSDSEAKPVLLYRRGVTFRKDLYSQASSSLKNFYLYIKYNLQGKQITPRWQTREVG